MIEDENHDKKGTSGMEPIAFLNEENL